MTYATAAPCSMSSETLLSLIDELERTPPIVESLAIGLTQVQCHFKPGAEPGAFSFVEQVHHLRDIEVEGHAERLRRTLAEDRPWLPDLDGTRLAIERSYNQQPMRPALARFSAARAASVELLRRVTPADLQRTAELEGVGPITLAQLLQRWLNHDRGHLAELRELIALLERG